MVAQRAGAPYSKTRGGEANAGRILDAALIEFSAHGFAGARIDAIANRSGFSKPNLLYYFRTKAELYLALLRRTLDMWLVPLSRMQADDDPIIALTGYITRKLEYARDFPEASRLFAMEIIRGAPILANVLAHELKEMVDAKVVLLESWMKDGRLARRDPHHFLFMIWATTQHYADFSSQIAALTGKTLADPVFFNETRKNIVTVLLGEIVHKI
jgi:TetR/AcrR family transcriptional regulator